MNDTPLAVYERYLQQVRNYQNQIDSLVHAEEVARQRIGTLLNMYKTQPRPKHQQRAINMAYKNYDNSLQKKLLTNNKKIKLTANTVRTLERMIGKPREPWLRPGIFARIQKYKKAKNARRSAKAYVTASRAANKWRKLVLQRRVGSGHTSLRRLGLPSNITSRIVTSVLKTPSSK
jgi:hypothetical protein